MKKKLALLFIGLLMGAMATSCGKRDTSETLQIELDLDKETADELSAMFNDTDEIEIEQPEYTIELVSPSAEIKNSKIGDSIIQLGNAVLRYDSSDKVADIIAKLETDNNYSLNLSADSDLTMNSMIRANTLQSFSLYDSDDNYVCTICGWSGLDGSMALSDLAIVYVDYDLKDMGALNVFFAGNICPGIYSKLTSVTESKEYAERNAEYKQLAFDEILPFIKVQGIAMTEDDLSKFAATSKVYSYRPVTYSSTPLYSDNYDDYYVRTITVFEVDENNSVCSNIYHMVDWAAGSWTDKNIGSLDEIPDDINDICAEIVDLYLNDYWNKNVYKADSAEVVAQFEVFNAAGVGGSGYTTFYFVLLDSNSDYLVMSTKIDRLVNGTIEYSGGINDKYDFNTYFHSNSKNNINGYKMDFDEYMETYFSDYEVRNMFIY